MKTSERNKGVFVMDTKLMMKFYETMVKIRKFELKANELFLANKLPGFLHLYPGEEAIATGVCSALRTTDYITSTHRGHGHLIAKGGDITKMFAELYGRQDGYCKGKGGSMHISDIDLGILGANGIVGAGIPIAVGAAFACKYKGLDSVAVSFFGDGASNRGTFHEGLNMAAAYQLPAVFICENNHYGISVSQDVSTSVKYIADRAAAYSMPGVTVDGNDVIAVYEAASRAIESARNGEGPSIVECLTYRQMGHFVGEPDRYRSEKEKTAGLASDPIPRFEKKMLEAGFTQEDLRKVRDNIDEQIAQAVKDAEAAPYPPVEALLTDVYAD